MTIEEYKLFAQGRQLWQQYLNLNGYSFEPNDKGLRALAETTGLTVAHLRKRIHAFLSA